MNYSSTITFESQLIPGAVYTLKKMSHGRRMAFNAAGAGIFQKLAELEREREPLQEEIERAEAAAKIEPCSCKHEVTDQTHDPSTKRCTEKGCACRQPQTGDNYRLVEELNNKSLEILINELTPLKLRWGIQKIEGLDIDGQPATLDSMLEKLPDAAIGEAAREIERLMKLSAEESLAFRSPTTGAAAVDGETPNLNAAPAGETNTGANAAA